MAYRITFGVRNLEDDWKHQLNAVIARRQGEIDAVLLQYGVPLLDEQSNLITAAAAVRRTSSVPRRAGRARPQSRPQSSCASGSRAPSSNSRCSISTGTSHASGSDCWRSVNTRTSQL